MLACITKLVFQSSGHLQDYTKPNSMKFRSSCLQMFFKIDVLQNFTLFTRKHLCWSLFLIKLQTFNTYFERAPLVTLWCSGYTNAQFNSLKSELRFCAGSNPARGLSEIRDGEDLWQWSRLEIRLRLSSVIIIITSNTAIFKWNLKVLYWCFSFFWLKCVLHKTWVQIIKGFADCNI